MVVAGAEGEAVLRLPTPCLVVLVGPSGSGKSAWAAANFRPDQVVDSDALRALVGLGRHDQRAGKDAFDVLDLVLERRCARRLTTVVDTLGLDGARRRGYLELARRHSMPCHAVAFDTPAEVCRARNRGRDSPVPAKVLASQLRAFAEEGDHLTEEGFARVHSPGPVQAVPPELLDAPSFSNRQREDPMALRFGLQLPSFTWPGGSSELGARLSTVTAAAEDAGFSSIWVMDHFLQIPQVGREWQDMPESYTTLGFLAGHTRTARLGTLVTGVTYRNIAHLAKIVATLDVLSGGRAVCGLGAAWFEREHKAYGWPFPAPKERYALLEDALRLLPLMWGPGSPAFEGATTTVAEAICYPRPLQEHVPILVGGGGERRTLRLVAQYADACNLFGDAATVRHKLAVLKGHCDAVGRGPEDLEVTHLSTVLAAEDHASLEGAVERLRPSSVAPEAYAAGVNAGTVEEHVGRFRELAQAGVDTAIVNMPDMHEPEALPRFAQVITAFRATAGTR